MSWALPLIRDLVVELENDKNSSTQDLLRCGDIVNDLLSVARTLLDDPKSSDETCQKLDSIVDVAYAKMAASHRSSIMCWRRLHTDASLLRCLAEVELSPRLDYETALDCVGRLDMVVIISGAAGEGRLDLITDVIGTLQAQHLEHVQISSTPCSLWLSSSNQPAPVFTATHGVLSLDMAPSLSSFQSHLHRHPFVIRGYARDWPAMEERPWRSAEYLRSVTGPGRVVPVEVGVDYRQDDWSQKLMSWDTFLFSLDRTGPNQFSENAVLYLAQHSLLTQFPALRADILIPDYVYASLPPPSDFQGYLPPRNEEQLVINAWLGPKGTISPAHTDPFFNFYAQIVGRKTVWLSPPATSPFMYPYTPSGASSDARAHNPAANTCSPSMSNTSRVDVFPHDRESSYREYPQFWESVTSHATSVTLEPGDLLFFPPGWWHAMRSEDTSFSVSMWF